MKIVKDSLGEEKKDGSRSTDEEGSVGRRHAVVTGRDNSGVGEGTFTFVKGTLSQKLRTRWLPVSHVLIGY